MAGLNDIALRILIGAQDNTGPGIRSATVGVQTLTTGIENLETAAKRILGITLFVGMAKEGIALSDSYKVLQTKIKLVSDASTDYAQVESELYEIAQRSHTQLEGTIDIYTKLSTAIKLLGGSEELALSTTETLNKAIALTSQGATQDAAAILQFSQALGMGALRGQDFHSVMEEAPGLMDAIAKGMGVPITKLKEMAEAEQLTTDKIVNALSKAAPYVAEKFAQLPLTVSAAFTQIHNALLVYIGESEHANDATHLLADGLHGIASHFDEVVHGVILLAEAYVGRLVVGIIASTKAFIDNATAARATAIATEQTRVTALALLQTEVQQAALGERLAQQAVNQAQAELALAITENDRAAALARLNAEQVRLTANQARMVSANGALAGAMPLAATATGLLSAALGVLSNAFGWLLVAWIAFDVTKTVGEWVLGAERMRIVGTYFSEVLELMTKGWSLVGSSFSERWAQIKAIHAEFDNIRVSEASGENAAAQATANAEQQKAQATEQAALKQKAAFTVVQDATKELTATIDIETKAQTAVIQQGLVDRIAAIDAANSSDAVKDSQRVQAKLAAESQVLQVQQAASTAKLQMIDQEYAGELASAKGAADRLAAVETTKRQAKLEVYQGVAEFYAGEITRLSELYGQENAAFAQSKISLQALAANHEQALTDIKRMGMDSREKIESEESEFDATMQALRQARKSGDSADQEKINELLTRAKTLNGELTQAAISSSTTIEERDDALYQAKERTNKLYEVEKQALADNAKAHEQNAQAVQSQLDTANKALADSNAKINEITASLSKDFLLKIGVDKDSLSEAQNQVANLTKPETKVITIVTQAAASAAASSDAAVAAQATGGPAGSPSHFADGGYPTKQGALPGYGGGDKIKALLEAGEFIVRKEAVQKLGMPVMNLINAGKLPISTALNTSANGIIRRALGGSVSPDEIAQAIAQKQNQADANLVGTMIENVGYYSNVGQGTGPNALRTTGGAEDAMINALNLSGKSYLTNYVRAAMAQFGNADMSSGKVGLDNSDKFTAVKDLVMQKIAAGTSAASTMGAKPIGSFMPTLSVGAMANQRAQQLAMNTNNITNQLHAGIEASMSKAAATSTVLQASQGPSNPQKAVNVHFHAPGEPKVSGQFNENDMEQLMRTLKSAGMRSSGSFPS